MHRNNSLAILRMCSWNSKTSLGPISLKTSWDLGKSLIPKNWPTMTIVHSTVFLKHSGSERPSSGGLCWWFLNRFANFIILTRRTLYSLRSVYILVINLHSLTRNCNPLCSRPLPTLLPNDVVVNGKLTPATWRITNPFSWKESRPAGLLLFVQMETSSHQRSFMAPA